MIYELQLTPLDGNLPPISVLIEALRSVGLACQNQPTGVDDGAVEYLSVGEVDHALEIALIEGAISLGIPVAYRGQAARDTFEVVWAAVRCLQATIPTMLFDPQLGQPIAVENAFDVEKVLMTYASLVRHLQSFEL